jgi:uncharacterized membrane protein YhhN
MTAASWALLAVAGVLALVDWVTVSGGSPALAHLEYAAKPGTLAALLVLAATVPTPDPARRDWFVVGLAFCLLGDVFLMLPGKRTAAFGAGLGSFLVAQGCFLAGLTRHGGHVTTMLVALAVLVVAAAIPGGRVLRAVVRGAHRWMAGPIVGYMAALLAMAAAAIAAATNATPFGTDAPLAAGALLFVASDTLLATDRFVSPVPRATLWVHATYHGAVVLLVLSLSGRPG